MPERGGTTALAGLGSLGAFLTDAARSRTDRVRV
ncbi:hypothetical protein SVIRM249S_00199 [Streptomyces viridochromogenes]